MNRAKWKTANEIFHAALDLPASERDSYVSLTSAGDTEVEVEVRRLLKADSEAGSYLETPIVPVNNAELLESTPFQSGDVLKQRFKIIHHVGQGGMGHVFEAFDLDLKVRVALKAIRSEIAANPIALDYFRREVRTARTITNANICRTFDFDKGSITAGSVSHQEYFFLTMEFLAGETLSEKIRRDGRLPITDALDLARQIASGLDSAHAVGIIHRDIKPANIMLVPGPGPGKPARAVIMDFGLARRDPLGPSVEGSAISHGAVVGTLAYMAPEQLDPGEKVSAATDIYSFGLVLFEMVTGQRAFPSANLLSGIAQRLSGPPPSPLALAPDLTPEWEEALHGCLRIDPVQRFQSASHVIQVLDGERFALPPVLPPAKAFRHRASPRPRRIPIYAAAAILMVAVSLFALWLRLHHQEENSKVASGALVYLTPVKNQTGDRALDNLTELLQAGLSQSAQINLLDQSRAGDTLQLMTKPPDTVIDPPIAREIALRTGAVRVVFASVTGSAGSYQLNIDIQQPDANNLARPRDNWPKSFPWTVSSSTANSATIPPDLLNAVRNSTDWIRFEVGESRNDIARLDTPPEDVTTSNWQAFAEYSQAERLISIRKREEAVLLLQNAVVIDPQFALAYGRLGDVLDSIGRSTEGYTYYTQALSADLQNRLTRRERDRIRGMFALDTGDERSAESAFRDYAAYYEYDYAGWFFRAHPLIMLGRTDEAIVTLKKAYELDKKRLSAPAHLARFYLVSNDHQSAWRWQAWLDANGFKADADFSAGQIDLDEQKYNEAQTSFNAMLQFPNPSYRSLAWSLLARYHAERGENDRALDALNHGIDFDTAQGFNAQRSSKLIDRASVRCKRSDPNNGFADIRRAVADDPGLQTIQSAASAFGRCRVAAHGSLDDQVSRELKQLQRLLPGNQANSILASVTKEILEGELLLAKGNWRAAIKEFSQADALEAPGENREYLARVYLIASEKAPSLIDRIAFREKAFETFGVTVHNEALVWYLMLVLPPGTYGDALAAYLSLGIELHKDPAALAPRLHEFSRLRESQFKSSPDLINALSPSSDLGKHLTTHPQGE